MPSEDYSAISTGALRLKGVASSSKIGKHKKKKKVKQQPPQSPDKATPPTTEQSTEPQISKLTDDTPDDSDVPRTSNDTHPPKDHDHNTEPQRASGKTEAELRHEERRRKRLDERLKREGIKTHKEKVEELNRYLSNLSEHHDMPRIGPG